MNQVSLKTVADFINGAAFKPQDWHDRGRRIIRIQNLNDPQKPFNLTNREVDEKYEVKKGDILVSWSASLGVFEWREDETALLNQHIFKVVPYEGKSDKSYLKYALNKALLDMSHHLHGSTMKHVNRGEFLSTKIFLPSVDEQRRIAAILDKAEAVRRKRKEAIALTEDLLRSAFLEMFGDPVTNPKGWNVVELASATESKLGKMLSKAAKKGINPVLYLGNSHVRWRAFDLTDLPTMDFSESELEKLSLRNGDLLICEGGEVGRCAIWRDDTLQISFQKAIHRVRCQKEKVLPEYLQEYFFTMAKSGGLVRFTSLATIAHLTGVRLKKLPLPLPPLERQEQFQQVYLKHESLIKTYKRLLETENSLFNSLLQRAFRGDL